MSEFIHSDYQTVISSRHSLMDLHIKETLKYKDLIALFVKRDFVSKYKQTILGPAWALIQPLLTTVVFSVVFGSLAKLTTADIQGDFQVPGFLFYMIGTICWSYFSSTLSATSNTFLVNSAVMGKVYYPRLVSPISTSLSNLISFGIQLVLFFVLWVFFLIKGGTSISITPMLAIIPLLILQIMVLAVGLGIIISSVTTKYRDLQMLVAFGLQLWQYGTPVAYGLTMIPGSSSASTVFVIYMSLNPMASIITAFRYAVFGFGYFNIGFYVIGWVETIIIFVIGLILFSRIERTFMDTV